VRRRRSRLPTGQTHKDRPRRRLVHDASSVRICEEVMTRLCATSTYATIRAAILRSLPSPHPSLRMTGGRAVASALIHRHAFETLRALRVSVARPRNASIAALQRHVTGGVKTSRQQSAFETPRERLVTDP